MFNLLFFYFLDFIKFSLHDSVKVPDFVKVSCLFLLFNLHLCFHYLLRFIIGSKNPVLCLLQAKIKIFIFLLVIIFQRLTSKQSKLQIPHRFNEAFNNHYTYVDRHVGTSDANQNPPDCFLSIRLLYEVCKTKQCVVCQENKRLVYKLQHIALFQGERLSVANNQNYYKCRVVYDEQLERRLALKKNKSSS